MLKIIKLVITILCVILFLILLVMLHTVYVSPSTTKNVHNDIGYTFYLQKSRLFPNNSKVIACYDNYGCNWKETIHVVENVGEILDVDYSEKTVYIKILKKIDLNGKISKRYNFIKKDETSEIFRSRDDETLIITWESE